jgi:nucleotide-binding universal stress UspA family protein
VSKRILVPTDGSEVSQKALEPALELAKQLGASIVAYHGIEANLPYYRGEDYVDTSAMKALEARAEEEAAKYVSQVKAAADAAGIPCDTVVTKPAVPHEGIVAAAEKNQCDLIVMSSHGRSGLRSFVLGSVTQRVLASSKIPVMVYR